MLLKVKKHLFIGMHSFQTYEINKEDLKNFTSKIINMERRDIFLMLEEKFSRIHNRNIVKVLQGTRVFWVFQDYFEVI
jgi:hypothetical protein